MIRTSLLAALALFSWAPTPNQAMHPAMIADERSGQGAAAVLRTYFALLQEGRHDQARSLWSGNGEASGVDAEGFAAAFAPYGQYHAEVGAPGPIEGAGGSLYVEIPVRVFGRYVGGGPFDARGTTTLRRVNDVPGSTPEQRRWHIVRSTVEPVFR